MFLSHPVDHGPTDQIPLVLSEDFQHGLEIEGISIRNPLLERTHAEAAPTDRPHTTSPGLSPARKNPR